MKTIKATKSVKTNVQPLHHITVYRNKDNVITKFRIRVKAAESVLEKLVDMTVSVDAYDSYQKAMLAAIQIRDKALNNPINAF
ncbi:TPA: hypothetical protein ACGCB0_004697 [Salmonella enterica subsp. enterica serovar Typhimurium]|nr:hypothetical protein [Salmonella enterica subsp. enterica serovar Bovismorbificans]EFD5176688.1 hypothetical protein [Escherichia coli]